MHRVCCQVGRHAGNFLRRAGLGLGRVPDVTTPRSAPGRRLLLPAPGQEAETEVETRGPSSRRYILIKISESDFLN